MAPPTAWLLLIVELVIAGCPGGKDAPTKGDIRNDTIEAAGTCLGQVVADRAVTDRGTAGVDGDAAASPVIRTGDVPPQRLVAGDRAAGDGQGAVLADKGPADDLRR